MSKKHRQHTNTHRDTEWRSKSDGEKRWKNKQHNKYSKCIRNAFWVKFGDSNLRICLACLDWKRKKQLKSKDHVRQCECRRAMQQSKECKNMLRLHEADDSKEMLFISLSETSNPAIRLSLFLSAMWAVRCINYSSYFTHKQCTALNAFQRKVHIILSFE